MGGAAVHAGDNCFFGESVLATAARHNDISENHGFIAV
jgi:hypothetical protein